METMVLRLPRILPKRYMHCWYSLLFLVFMAIALAVVFFHSLLHLLHTFKWSDILLLLLPLLIVFSIHHKADPVLSKKGQKKFQALVFEIFTLKCKSAKRSGWIGLFKNKYIWRYLILKLKFHRTQHICQINWSWSSRKWSKNLMIWDGTTLM